jgi:hypothetical protein
MEVKEIENIVERKMIEILSSKNNKVTIATSGPINHKLH